VTAGEFATVLAWLLLPPAMLGVAGLVFVHRRSQSTFKSCALACALLLVLSCLVALAMVAFGPKSLGNYIGIKDTPFMWAPFAFIAVSIAFPFTALWLRQAGVK
jgi:hypothetical protein